MQSQIQNVATLHASEERSRFLIEGVRDYAIFMLDLAGNVETWNSGAEKIIGYNAAEAIGQNQSLYYPPEDVAEGKPQRELEQAAAEGSLEEEGWRLRKSGERFWSNGVLTALYDDDGKVRGFAKVTRDLTERKRNEESLRASEERTRLLIEGVQDYAIFTLDLAGAVQTWNSGAQKITGYDATEAIGHNQALYYPAEDVAEGKPQRELDQAASIGSLEEEGWRVRKSGERFWSNGVLTALFDDHGKVCGFAKVTRDLTERKRNEESLRASEERLRFLIEGVKDYAIFMLDPNGNVLTWNSGAELTFGYTAAEAIGGSYSQFFNSQPGESNQSQCQTELDRAVAEGTLDITGWRFRKDGSRFWANGILTALYNQSGELRGFAKITRNLTSQHRLETLLRSVLDNTQDSIICIDLSGTIAVFNEAAVDAFGYSQAEAIGNNLNILMPEPLDEKHDSSLGTFLHSAATNANDVAATIVCRHRDGTIFPAQITVTEIQNEIDGGRHFIGVIHDLTKQRKLEAQLHQAQKMEAFGQLAGGVAHDFNNLLTVINGYSELLISELPCSDPKVSSLEQIQRAGERGASLTRQLLAFSRQQVLEPTVLDLNALVSDMQKMLGRLVRQDILVTANLSPRLSLVKVDASQIGQVIMNLAVNAADAMPQGGKLIIETQDVELGVEYARDHPEVTPGWYVLLAMTDMGCGMTPEVRTRIFEPFFTTKGIGKGTGLGLPVVQGIVNQSRGSIDICSEVGKGTSFKIYLPAVSDLPIVPSAPNPTEPIGGTETILLVEDEDAVRDLTSLALRNFGYTVLEASSGREAVRVMACHNIPVDLLLTDVVMPEMGGAQVADILQSRCPGLRVLYMSGYMDDAVFRHGVLHDKVAFLHKPFAIAALAGKVRQVLDN